MKDKILFPSIIVTLLLVILFLLVCLASQGSRQTIPANAFRNLGRKTTKLHKMIVELQGNIALLNKVDVALKTSFTDLKTDIVGLKTEIVELGEELAESEWRFKNHYHKRNKLIFK